MRRLAFAALAIALAGSAGAEPNLPPGQTGGGGANQAAGPSGQNPGQAGEIGGAGPHPGPSHASPQTPAQDAAHPPADR